ncbi:MAG TPA: hypothetical protein VF701_15290 [Thermoanaerobaculia bacterium]
MSPVVLFAAGTLALLLIALAVVRFRSIRRANERAEEYRKQAALRGWTLEYDRFGSGTPWFRYSGVTEEVSWTFHTYRPPARLPAATAGHPSRWETTSVRLDEGALAVFPGSAEHRLRPGAPRFVTELALRPIVNALGGDAEDAPVLASATRPLAGPKGYTYRTSDMRRMAGWLTEGASHAFSTMQIPDLIAIVLWHRGLQIATARATNDLEQIARIVDLGVRLTKAAELMAKGPRPAPRPPE